MIPLDSAHIAEPVASDQPQAMQIAADNETRGQHHPRKRLLNHLLRKQVPVVLQMSAVECGAACLAMILAYYGRQTSISEIREQCGIGRDGFSAFGLIKAARAYGMRGRAFTVESNDVRFITFPAIIHWDFNHFLVLEQWSSGAVTVVDPSTGRRSLTIKEFEQRFTCVVITLEPSAAFERQGSTAKMTMWAYAAHYVKLAPGAFLQVIGASFLLQLFGLATPVLTKV